MTFQHKWKLGFCDAVGPEDAALPSQMNMAALLAPGNICLLCNNLFICLKPCFSALHFYLLICHWPIMKPLSGPKVFQCLSFAQRPERWNNYQTIICIHTCSRFRHLWKMLLQYTAFLCLPLLVISKQNSDLIFLKRLSVSISLKLIAVLNNLFDMFLPPKKSVKWIVKR